MTEPIRRKLPCSDNGSALPWDAVDYQNRDNAETVGLWNWACYWVDLTGVNDLVASTGLGAEGKIIALVRGMQFVGIAPANTTAAMTVTVDDATIVDLTDEKGDPLGDGAIEVDSLIRMIFDGTRCRLIVGGAGGGFGSGTPDIVIVDQKANNVDGGTFTSGAQRTRDLNEVVRNTVSGFSLNAGTGEFTLQGGGWWVEFDAPAMRVNGHQARLFCVTDAAVVADGEGTTEFSDTAEGTNRSFGGVYISIGAAKTYRIEHRCESTNADDGFGNAAGFGNFAIYTRVRIYKEGAQDDEIIGYPGGPIVIQYLAELGSTTNADPGPGKLKFNQAVQNTATRIYSDLLNAALVDVTNLIDNNFAASSSTVKGQLNLYVNGDPTKFITFNVTALTAQAGWREITVAPTAWSAASPFVQGDVLNLQFTRTGDIGATGADGGAFRYLWDTSTSMADPGAGDVRGNNGALASITAIAISNASADSGNPDVSDLIVTWDDSSTTANRGTLLIKKIGAPQNFVAFEINGAITDSGAWLQIPVAYKDHAGSLANADALSITFFRTGDAGAGSAATDGEMEAAASVTAFTTPGRQQLHPSAAKFSGKVTVAAGVPTLVSGDNVAAIVDTATGRLGVTIGTDFSSANYTALVSVERVNTTATTANRRSPHIRPGSQAAGSIEFWCLEGSSEADADPAAWHFAGFGDQ